MTAIGHGRPADEDLPRRRELAELLAGAQDLAGDSTAPSHSPGTCATAGTRPASRR